MNSQRTSFLFTFIFTLIFIGCDSDDNSVEQRPTSTEKLEKSSPWITTAVFKVVDGKADTSVNFIEDPIAEGTVSSAQYRDGKFIFVPVDPITGDFEMPITESHTANYGKYKISVIDGIEFRELFDTNFGYTNKREIIELTKDKLTYSFQAQGTTDTYYVEHEPYAVKFPNKEYPQELTDVVDQRFESIE